jgi:pSer/pThr/pTyr-binding forkhead associated (FHA) protein
MIHLLTIGRDSENDIVINEASVSGKHAELFKDDEGRFFLTDLNSKN